MTLLPAVREQIDAAATRRSQARPARLAVTVATRRPQVPLAAAAVALVAALALLFHGWTAPRPQPEQTAAAPVIAASVMTPATPARLREATDLRWSAHLSDILP